MEKPRNRPVAPHNSSIIRRQERRNARPSCRLHQSDERSARPFPIPMQLDPSVTTHEITAGGTALLVGEVVVEVVLYEEFAE